MRVINSGSPLVFQLLGTDTWGLSRGPPAVKLLVTQNSYNVLSTQLSEELTIHTTDTVFDRCLEIEEYHTCMHIQYAVASRRLSLLSILLIELH